VSAGAAWNPGRRTEGGGELLERAAELLGRRPLSTPALAQRLLGVSPGAPGAAGGAVWALLGPDPRFRVSREGVWSLASAPPEAGTALRERGWIVVDVETTGGSPGAGHRVTEVAAVEVVAGEIRGHWSSLVNPERPIPANITSLTGITDAMVAGAPPFRNVAERCGAVLHGGVFVAHNVGFDWRFISAEMERATGRALAGPQLCTVKLARKLLPHLPSRSLGPLARYFGLAIESRHRALDDAVATAHVLLRFVDMLEQRGVTTWGELEAFLGRRTPRTSRRRSAMPRSMDSA
jgi:DNA polymerase-3 subunit epsilon